MGSVGLRECSVLPQEPLAGEPLPVRAFADAGVKLPEVDPSHVMAAETKRREGGTEPVESRRPGHKPLGSRLRPPTMGWPENDPTARHTPR